mgnify:CR=1 FL=1
MLVPERGEVTIMTVEPGFGGQSFIPEVLSKAKAVRRLVDSGELTLIVEIDGSQHAWEMSKARAAAKYATSEVRRCAPKPEWIARRYGEAA